MIALLPLLDEAPTTTAWDDALFEITFTMDGTVVAAPITADRIDLVLPAVPSLTLRIPTVPTLTLRVPANPSLTLRC